MVTADVISDEIELKTSVFSVWLDVPAAVVRDVPSIVDVIVACVLDDGLAVVPVFVCADLSADVNADVVGLETSVLVVRLDVSLVVK